MANEIGSLIVRIGADVDDLLKGTKKSQTALENFAAVGEKAGLAVAGAALAAASAIAAMSIKGLQLGDDLAKAAERLNVTATELAGLRYAAALANIEAETLDGAMVKLAKSTSEAAHGSKQQADAFRELGLSAEEIRKLPLTEQMLKVGDALEGVTNQTDKLRIASDLFGRGAGAQMLNLFKQGSAAIREQLAEAQKLGLFLDTTQTRVVQDAADAQTKMGEAFKGLSMQLGAAFAPAIKAASEAIVSITATVTKALPHLQALAERFLGIKAAADDLSDSTLHATLLEDIQAMDTLNDRISDQQRLLKMAGGPANEQALNDLLKDQADLQKRINDLLAETSKRRKDAASGAGTPQTPSVDTEWMNNLEKALKPAQDEITKTEEMLFGLFQTIHDQEEKSATETETLLFGVFQSIREQENATATETERIIEETFAAIQKQTKDRFTELQTRFSTEIELENKHYKDELDLLQKAEDDHLATVEKINEMREQAEQQHQTNLTNLANNGVMSRKKFEEMSTQDKVSNVLNSLAQMTAGVAQHNKAMFKVNKAASLGAAIMNTAQGVTKALADYPPPISFVMAAAQAAAGLAQIQAIKATTFEGGGGGTTPSSAGASPVVNGQAQQNAGQTITVRGVNPGQLFSGRQVVDLLNAAVKDGAKLVFQD